MAVKNLYIDKIMERLHELNIYKVILYAYCDQTCQGFRCNLPLNLYRKELTRVAGLDLNIQKPSESYLPKYPQDSKLITMKRGGSIIGHAPIKALSRYTHSDHNV